MVLVTPSRYVWFKSQHVGGNALKIYCVTVVTGSVTEHHLHTKYQSATQSLAHWNKPWRGRSATLSAAWVSGDAWKPVDSQTERRLAKVQKLWDELIETDQEGLDALLDALIKRQKPAAPVLATGGIVRGPQLLTDQERTEAMLSLNRLVDAS